MQLYLPHVQQKQDRCFIALAGASGGAMSGMVVANSSYAALSLAGGVLAFMLIPVVIWSRKG